MPGPIEEMFKQMLGTLVERFGDHASQAQKERFSSIANRLLQEADGLVDIGSLLRGDFAGLTKENLSVAMYAVPGFVHKHAQEFAELKDAAHDIYETNPPQMKRALQERIIAYVTGKEPTAGYTEFLPQSQAMLDKGTQAGNALMGDLFGGQAPASAPGASPMKGIDPTTLPLGNAPSPAAPPPSAEAVAQSERLNSATAKLIRLMSDGARDIVRETPLGDLMMEAVGLPPGAQAPTVLVPAQTPTLKLPAAQVPSGTLPSITLPGADIVPALPHPVEAVEGSSPATPPRPSTPKASAPLGPKPHGKPAHRKAG